MAETRLLRRLRRGARPPLRSPLFHWLKRGSASTNPLGWRRSWATGRSQWERGFSLLDTMVTADALRAPRLDLQVTASERSRSRTFPTQDPAERNTAHVARPGARGERLHHRRRVPVCEVRPSAAGRLTWVSRKLASDLIPSLPSSSSCSLDLLSPKLGPPLSPTSSPADCLGEALV